MWYLHVFAGFKRQAPTDSSGFLLTSIDSLTPAIRHGNEKNVPLKQMIFPLKSLKPPFIDCLGISHGLPCFAEAKCSVSQRGLGRTKGNGT